MRKRLLLSLTLTVILAGSPALAEVVAVRENGRTIYVDEPAPRTKTSAAAPPAAAGGRTRTYVYWSKSEGRWKRVPPASGATMRAARSALAEVNRYVEARAASAPAPEFRVDLEQEAQPVVVKSEQLDAIIEAAAGRHKVDANLVRALIKVESNFNPRARSHKGAMGLMQLMPATARSLKVANPYDPQQNVDGGVRHLKQLLENFNGDVTLSLAAYNAGAGAVQRNNGVPPYTETRNYVRRIHQLYGGGDVVAPRAAGSAPIRVFRTPEGVLTFTNE